MDPLSRPQFLVLKTSSGVSSTSTTVTNANNSNISSSTDYVDYVRRLAGGGGGAHRELQFHRRSSAVAGLGGMNSGSSGDVASSSSSTSLVPGGRDDSPSSGGGRPGMVPPLTFNAPSYFSGLPGGMPTFASGMSSPAIPYSPRGDNTHSPEFLSRHKSDYGKTTNRLTEENLQKHDGLTVDRFQRTYSSPPSTSDLLFSKPSQLSSPGGGKPFSKETPFTSSSSGAASPAFSTSGPSSPRVDLTTFSSSGNGGGGGAPIMAGTGPGGGTFSGSGQVRFGNGAGENIMARGGGVNTGGGFGGYQMGTNFHFPSEGGQTTKFDHLLTWLLNQMDENGNLVIPNGEDSTPLSRGTLNSLTTVQSQELTGSGEEGADTSPISGLNSGTEGGVHSGNENSDPLGGHTPTAAKGRSLAESWHMVATPE